ncbi:hypothetical protein NQ318_011564 [Aromia moschata]|uniref:Uncharacterized protein n=1 Tax=Aromia moschata TaxID=1265417 RepID=A0AAV8Z8G5_9CUCU|nr:hypothetical protein NQ318_011564 [Aromia moschata]
MTSIFDNRTQVSGNGRQNLLGNELLFIIPVMVKDEYLPKMSLTPANVITNEATKRSAIAREARKRLPIRRRPRSVYIATHTRMFPATERNISSDRNVPAKEKHTMY